MSTIVTNEPRLILSFRADGPFWEDLVHLLAYPDGISYVWPFRYKSTWVEPQLFKNLEVPLYRKRLIGTEMLIGARFQGDSAAYKLVPIRKATITSVAFSAGVMVFSFRLGHAFQFFGANSLNEFAIHIKTPMQHLAFREDVAMRDCWATDEESLAKSWKAFSDMIATESHLPINDAAKRSLFLHFKHPQRRGASRLAASELRSEFKEDSAYGYALKQGSKYKLEFAHNVPALAKANTTVLEINVEPRLPTKDIEANTAELRLLGNYGLQHILFAAVNKTAMFQSLVIAPASNELVSQTDDIHINAPKMSLLLASTWSFRHWLARSFIPGIALFVALAIIGSANVLEKVFDALVEGKMSETELREHWPLIVIVVGGSLLGSFVVPALFGKAKEK